jgi:actin-like ATPase involved in cell morphogenesis
LQSLQQEAFQLAQDVFTRKVDVNAAISQLYQQLQQHLGSNSQLINSVQPLIQQLINAVRSVLQSLSSNVATRSVSAGGTDLFALAKEFGIHTLEDIIAVFPQYEVIFT